jgi:hypothetical protein
MGCKRSNELREVIGGPSLCLEVDARLVAAVAGQYGDDDFGVRSNVSVLTIGDDVIEPDFEAVRARRDFQYLCAIARLGGVTRLHAIDEQQRVHRRTGDDQLRRVRQWLRPVKPAAAGEKSQRN